MSDVTRFLAVARSEAEQHQWPVAVVRLDGCAPISAYIAIEKARTSALGRHESKTYEDMVNGGRNAFFSAPLLTALEGGVPVVVGGQIVSAIGVWGIKSDQDAQIAPAGAQSMT
ncbi:heme-binding protein [Pseudomonas sp. LFM046]|uniref:heme-binding protein n=1 Tax=Pseudomonas sp. LFM046 TaxID=1608357 RepID=UPI000AEFEE8A|nr:heme-binding protein [Pseudomonas sp. LFM046]